MDYSLFIAVNDEAVRQKLKFLKFLDKNICQNKNKCIFNGFNVSVQL